MSHLNDCYINQARQVRFSFVTEVALSAAVILNFYTPQARLPALVIQEGNLLPNIRYEFQSDLLETGTLFPVSTKILSHHEFPLKIETQIGSKMIYVPQIGFQVEQFIFKSVERMDFFSSNRDTLEAVQVRWDGVSANAFLKYSYFLPNLFSPPS